MAGRGNVGGQVLTAREAVRRHNASVGEFDDTEMTTIIPIDELESYDPASEDAAVVENSWSPATWEPYYRPTRSEITQDILIPEGEFEAYGLHADDADPFDANGARLDSFTDEAGLGTTHSGELALGDIAGTSFRRIPDPERVRTRGKHRIAAPPNALRGGRAALVAMAAGAAVAAVAHVSNTDDAPTVATPANAANVDPAAGTVPDLGPGIAASDPTSQDLSTFTDQLAVGKQMAAAEAQREALASRPMFVSPLPLGSYQFTSGFAMRWGSFHGGIDFAAPLGTPIHAATDGVVIEAGPASGYGNWVQIRANDGTVTMYGHMASSGVLVQKGQHVTAGDVIALVGSEGFSTGPHCHFEVWKNGTMKIDPAPWLAEHGVRLSAYTG